MMDAENNEAEGVSQESTSSLGPPTKPSRDVIIFTENTGLKGSLRGAVKAFGVTSPELPESFEDCEKALLNLPSAWLLMDTVRGMEVTAKVLSVARKSDDKKWRAIYVVAPEGTPAILSLALEYGVSKVRVGTVVANDLHADLQVIGEREAVEGLLFEVLHKIQKHHQEGQYDQAIELIRSELKINPNHAGLRISLVDSLVLKEQWDEAESEAHSMQSTFPKNLRGSYTLARVLMKQNKFEEASKVLVEAEKISELNADRLLAMGECFLQLGAFDEARKKFLRAMDMDPESKEAQGGVIKADLLNGNFDQAMESARDIGSPADMAKILNSAAIIGVKSGQSDRSQRMYAQGIALLGGDTTLTSRMWFNMGLLHFKGDKIDQAIQCFEESKQLDPTFDAAAKNIVALEQRKKLGPQTSSASKDQSQEVSELQEIDEVGMPDV